MTETYVRDGRKYDRVTEVLQVINDGLSFLRKNEKFEEMYTASGEEGTDYHALLDDIVNDRETPKTTLLAVKNRYPIMMDGVEIFRTWFHETVEEVVWARVEPIFCTRYFFAGTPDAIFVLKGDKHPVIVDFKRTAGFYKKMALQLGAYRYLVENYLKIKNCERAILRISKENKMSPVKYLRDHDRDLNGFLNFLGGYRTLMAI